MIELNQSWPRPKNPLPIVIFGAGSIVRDAHIPAYQAAGFPIRGIYDPDLKKAGSLAAKHGFSAYSSLSDAAGQTGVVFDLATPPAAHKGILESLPRGATVLMQKPMGADLQGATEILQICRERKLNSAVNFQLRFAPMMLALRDAIDKGLLGEVVDFDAWLALDTPWGLWEFLKDLPRVEILLHSIHYLDFIRSLLGNPQGVHAKTIGHPNDTTSNTRTAAILDYGDRVRCALSINHNHAFGRKHQACEFRICGTKGAAYLQMGVNLDYPKGEPDILEINTGAGWETIPLQGSWFTESFGHRMAQVQRVACCEEDTLVSGVEDAWHTMALVEAAYESSAAPATPLARKP
jgi:predicted dehydrogenase